MKETEDRHEHMHTERSDIDHLSFSERLVEQQVLVYLSDTTGYIYTIIISYNIIIWTHGPHSILRLQRSRGQERMPPIPLELLACELVLGVHPASETSNLKKGVNTYIYE